jgi:cell division septation protein DedD
MGDYLVTLGSYASAANAQALVVRLRAARLPVSTRVVAVGSGSGHAVVLGPFADRAAAEQARLAALKVRGDLPARVVVADAAPPAAQAAPAKPVATAAKPATAPPAAAVTRPASIAQGFVVQLVAVADRAKADALRDQLRKAGITAYTEQVSSAHGVLSRVRAGPVATRVEAEQLQANIRQRFGIEGSLRPYP